MSSTFKAHVKTVDMSEEMEKDAIEFATQALNDLLVEKDMAAFVRPAAQLPRSGRRWTPRPSHAAD